MTKYINLDDTVYFWFAANDTSGSGADGASPLYDVREGGEAAGAAPLESGTPTLLTHANYPAGLHEIAVTPTSGEGFEGGKEYAVFCTLLVDSQNPSGFVGDFKVGGVHAVDLNDLDLATSDQVSGIANVGAATNTHAIDAPNGFVITTGSGEVNDEDDTHALDGTEHQISDSGGTLDVYYMFDLEGIAAPVSVTLTGRVVNAANDLKVYVNTGTQASPVWSQRGTLGGQASPTNLPHTYVLFTADLMTGVDAGKVAFRLQNTGLSAATLYVDQVYCSKTQNVSVTGYANGSIWIDTLNGVPGTVVNVNGTADNPSSNVTDALAISTATNLVRFQIVSGSTITLIADATGMVGIGEKWTLDPDGNIVTGATVIGAHVAGVADATSTDTKLVDCQINTCSLTPFEARECTLNATLTLLATGDYKLIDCVSGVAGAGAPTVDLGAAIGGSNVEFRRWSGGLTLLNVNTSDVVSVDALTGGTLTVTLAGGTVEARGSGMKSLVVNGSSGTVNVAGYYGTVTDNSGGAVTITPTWHNSRQSGDSFGRIGAFGGGLTLLGGMSSVMQTQTEVAVSNSMAAINLDHLMKTVVADQDNMTTEVANGSVLSLIMTSNGTTTNYVPADDALQSISDKVVTVDTSIATILARMGAFTGTGVNTILGFFLSLLKKDAVTPSDIGGTYDPATDSQEAHTDVGVILNTAGRNAMASTVFTYDMSNVEATAGQHTLCFIVLAGSESSTEAFSGFLTVYRTDGITEFAKRPITTDAAADPVTGIS
jgi:hypothetical protein